MAVAEGAADRFQDSSVDLPAEHCHNGDKAAEKKEKLQHIGPDHRFHSAHHRIDYADRADQQDGEPCRPAVTALKDLGGGIKHHAEVHGPGIEGADCDDGPDGSVVSVFEILIRRETAEQKIEPGEQEIAGNRQSQPDGSLKDEEREAVVEDLPRHHDDGDRTEQGNHAGESDCQRRHPPSAEQVLFGTVLAFGKEESDTEHQYEIEDNNGVVQEKKAAAWLVSFPS